MFGLTRREQLWKERRLCAELLVDLVKAALKAESEELEIERLRAENAQLRLQNVKDD
jgi:hypothetical protein